MAGLGLQGAYGVAGGQDELEKLVADRLRDTLMKQQAAQQQAELALKTRGLDIDERQGDARIGLEGQRVGFEGERVGLDKDRFGFEKDQWAETLPQRTADLENRIADTWNIRRQPEVEAANRAHDGSMIDKRGTWNLREIGASGAQQRMTQSHGAGLKPTGPQVDPEAERTLAEINRLANALRTHKGMPSAFGLYQSSVPVALRGQDAADAETLLGSLRGLLTLGNMGKMKGVLSDTDIKIIQQASTTLDPKMGDAAAAAELDRLIGASGGVSRAQIDTGNMGAGNPNANLAGEYDFVNGKLVRRGGG
jgi:hypothetical protein